MHLGTGCAVSAVSAKRSPRLLAEALDLTRRGAAVFPLQPHGKEPLTPHGCHDASRDEATVRAWWARLPQANVGLATGAGLLVLDVDPRHGGADSLADLPPLPPRRRDHVAAVAAHVQPPARGALQSSGPGCPRGKYRCRPPPPVAASRVCRSSLGPALSMA